MTCCPVKVLISIRKVAEHIVLYLWWINVIEDTRSFKQGQTSIILGQVMNK